MSSPENAVRISESDWDSRARRWLTFEDEMERYSAPLGELAMARLQMQRGEHVVDVGCGTGRSSLALAERVGTAGHVVGIDISSEMVRRARQHAAGVSNVDFVCADAADYEFAPRFDALFSRFGVMFFADPLAGFSNLLGSLRPGGRLAFVSWDDVRTNEWFMITSLAVVSVTRTPLANSALVRRAPFSLANPATVTDLLTRAGFRKVRVTRHTENASMTEAELERRLELSIEVTGLREVLDGLEPEIRSRVVEGARTSLWRRLQQGRISLRVGVLVVEAVR